MCQNGSFILSRTIDILCCEFNDKFFVQIQKCARKVAHPPEEEGIGGLIAWKATPTSPVILRGEIFFLILQANLLYKVQQRQQSQQATLLNSAVGVGSDRGLHKEGSICSLHQGCIVAAAAPESWSGLGPQYGPCLNWHTAF